MTETNLGVRELVVVQGFSDQRIDNFLQRELKGVPRSYIYRILRKGEVRVNKGRVKPVYRVQTGDIVRIPPVRITQTRSETPGQSLLKMLSDRILLEDEHLLVIDKPAGLAVHGGSGLRYGLIEGMRAIRPDCQALELVHRLDRATSGCILIAKKRSILVELHALLRDKHMTKTYWALIQGKWPKKKVGINVPLQKNTLKSGERLVTVHRNGKASLTEFRMLRKGSTASLVEAKPVTGRTHQIRVHAQYAGHPIAGDDKYGEAAFDEQMKNQGLKRLFLHAHTIRFQLSVGAYAVTAPLDNELQNVLTRLGLGQ